MTKKKILHLISGLDVGGTELQLLKILPKLQNNFDNRVCCIRGHGPVGKLLNQKGVPVYYLDLRKIYDFQMIFKFRKVIKEFKPDILVTYLIHADLFGRTFGKMFSVKKIVCSQRGVLLQWEYLRKVDRLTKFLVTKYLVQTEVTKKELMGKLNLSKEKFTVIPNSIDVNFYKKLARNLTLRKKLGVAPSETAIICVGNFHLSKGHRYLLEAFEAVYQKNKKVKLLLAGDGAEKENLKKQIKKYRSKENIIFLGKRTDIPKLLKISDIFVLPTLGEGMSNAILEAMATGLPAIVTDIPQNKEVIEEGKTGVLVPHRDSASIAKSIIKIINNPQLGQKI